ncbi:polyhydroxyalkanoic acid system protein, partial [Pseudomonas syringae]|nr:polyhydroxyalkanoic acid system protein [Pseudomonas syringae]
MAKITVERPHALGLGKARQKAHVLVDKLSTRRRTSQRMS